MKGMLATGGKGRCTGSTCCCATREHALKHDSSSRRFVWGGMSDFCAIRKQLALQIAIRTFLQPEHEVFPGFSHGKFFE